MHSKCECSRVALPQMLQQLLLLTRIALLLLPPLLLLLLLPLPQLEEDFIKANPAWVAELELMLKRKEKAEIQALSSFGFQYLSQVYLPLKLQEGDWI